MLVQGDITPLAVDVIVNAANASLLGGGRVDGAIHQAAGPGLLAECHLRGGCPTGEARITRGYRLPAHHVIHTVGPIWQGGTHGAAALLAACYRNRLLLTAASGLNILISQWDGIHENPHPPCGHPLPSEWARDSAARPVVYPTHLSVIAFPAISTGVAVQPGREFLHQHPDFERLILVCFGPTALAPLQTARAKLLAD